jgi:hypothetical protein
MSACPWLLLFPVADVKLPLTIGHCSNAIYARGYGRHPEDRVPPHRSSKSRQGAWRASTHYHVCCSFGPLLPAEEVASALPCVPRPQTSPPCRGELRYCHVSRGPGPCLPAEVSSDATMCHMAPSSASLRGELWCCHVSQSFGLCLAEREAPVLPRVPRLGALP